MALDSAVRCVGPDVSGLGAPQPVAVDVLVPGPPVVVSPAMGNSPLRRRARIHPTSASSSPARLTGAPLLAMG
jgi:hypothetical protein